MAQSILSAGSFGERLDLKIKQGSTLGPFDCTMVNPDDTPVDLTGSEIRGQIRRTGLNEELILDLDVTLTDAANGEWTFGLSASNTEALLAGEEITDSDSIYVWDMEMVDVLSRIIPLYHGVVRVYREATR